MRTLASLYFYHFVGDLWCTERGQYDRGRDLNHRGHRGTQRNFWAESTVRGQECPRHTRIVFIIQAYFCWVRGGSLKVLLLENISGVAASQFEEAGFEVQSLKGGLEERELVEKVRGASILGVRSKTRITAAVLDAAPELVSVGAFCIGVDKIDRVASSDRGIAVFNDPHSNSRSVAELAMGEIILLMRRTFEASTRLHGGVWNKSSAGSHEVRGLTLGIVGYGKIGSQVSDLAEAMGMRVVFHDVAHVLARGNARAVSFRELLETSDVITLHVDGKPQNQNLFGEDEIRGMKDGACLINLSRGFVVDHEALARHLKSGKLSGAAVDVFPQEPESGGSVCEPRCRGCPT